MNIKVLSLENGRVLVEPEKVAVAGVELSYELQKNAAMPTRGKVIAHSEDLAAIIKAKDTIYYRQYAPDKIEVDGKEFFFVEAKDLLGIDVSPDNQVQS